MKFGVREIVDVVFKAADNNQKVGTKIFQKYQPVFTIDTATTSSLEQSTTTVYAQGGKGYARLIAWEGEKQMTFTVTDALMSPMGLAVLTGAGLIKPGPDNENPKEKVTHFHVTINKGLDENGQAEISLGDLREETGLNTAQDFKICTLKDVKPYATKLDASGAGIDWYDNVVFSDATGVEYITVDASHNATVTVKKDADNVASGTVQLDFYLVINNPAAITEVDIEPGSFGGYFYVEAQTLYRREDTGKDMAAEIILPRVKVQSNFTFTMAASGDPSTFDFVMDAFPGYLRFDKTKKLMCKIQILGSDNEGIEEEDHKHTEPNPVTPSFPNPDVPVTPSIDISGSAAVGTSTIPAGWPYDAEYQENQEKLNVTVNNDTIAVTVTGGIDSLNEWTSTDPGQAALGDKPWIALDIDTGLDDITKVSYNGSALTAQDVADAAAWGLGAGHFILWLRADDVHTGGKTFTLSGDDMDSVTVSITVDDAA